MTSAGVLTFFAHSRPGRQGGVALAIVLWFIAGMSLLVAGIVSQAQVDTRMAQAHVARAKAVAAGDGAIRLMMADLLTGKRSAEDAARPLEGSYLLGAEEVSVRLVPAAGLIDINRASAEELLALFLWVGVADDEARLLAENVLKSRSPAKGSRARSTASGLDAIEDLLRVPGMSRALLDTLRDFIVVGAAAQGGTNWSLAPDEVLAILQTVDETKAGAARARREAGLSANGGRGLVRAYRADAVLRYGDRDWLRRRWIEISGTPGGNLPWSVVRTEPPRVVNNELMDRSADAG